MKTLLHKTSVLLLLGGYFLAVTVGGAFHTHRGSASSATTGEANSAGPHAVLVCHGCGGAPSDRTGQPRETVACGRVVDHSHCPICDFLAQTPICTVPVVCLASAGVAEPVVLLPVVAWVAQIRATFWSRGPPPVA
ncbi:MAG: hypothetical protein ACOX1P_03070 [Thermoguttaceae bacterium]